MNINASNYNAYNIYNNPIHTKSLSHENAQEEQHKVLGFNVDKIGNFKSDFNKTLGIDENIKINADTIGTYVNAKTTKSDRFASYDSIDIVKTFSNAYENMSAKDKEIFKNSSNPSEVLVAFVDKNSSLIEGDVSYMGRLKGLDKDISADEFRLQIGLVNSEYNNNINGLKKADLDKMPDYIKDIINFTNDLKELRDETIKNPIDDIYAKLDEEQKDTFASLQQNAKNAIIKLNHARSDIFASQMFGSNNLEQQSAQSLEDFTSFFMKAQDFFNNTNSTENTLNATQLEFKNAFSNLYKQQATLINHINFLA